jgi:hypothetical protein
VWNLLPQFFNQDTGKYEYKWKPFQERLPTEQEARDWFERSLPPGIATIGGKVSGNLEQLDFDREAADLFPRWCALVQAEAPGLLDRLCVVRTPRQPAGRRSRSRLGKARACISPVMPAN